MQKRKSNTVKLILDLNNPPKLTDAQRAEMIALRPKSDDEIDYSDIPELDDAFWASARRAIPIEERLKSSRNR